MHLQDGRTPLHLACEHGNMEAAAALIGLGGADLGARDASGSTPLHIAVDKNHLQLAKSLMDRGAALDTTTNVRVYVEAVCACAFVLGCVLAGRQSCVV